jgi:hypothetical protein
MLTNIMGEDMEGRGDVNQPLLFYGDYVNGSFRFRSADSQNGTQNTADTPEGASENENQEAGNENDGDIGTQGEETTGQNGGARINGINR